MLAREPLDAPALPAPATEPQPASQPAATAPLDLDAIYEHVASRLRRELLHDRERIGDLIGDLRRIGPPR